MTEDILFDNIYVGHSVEDADAFAAETYKLKKSLEVSADKAAAKEAEEEDEEELVSFKEDPIAFLRGKVITFVELAKEDPVSAFKTHPETGAGLAVVLITFFGMLGTLFGLVGGQQKPITKVHISF